MVKRVSIKGVAQAAGVSTATVSNVFSGKKPVNADLAEKVRRAADKLGYQVNKAASNLRSGRNSVVSVLVPDLSDPFFTSIITEIEGLAQDDGYEIIVGNSGDNAETERGRLDALLAWQPAGIVVMPCSDTVPARLHESDLPPCVLVDRVSQFDVNDTVTIDNAGAGATAAKFLADNGHRRLLVAASHMAYTPIRERSEGAHAEMFHHNGSVDLVELGSVPQRGAESLAKWLDANPLPSAIFATNDMTTLAVLTCLAARRIDMPEQISVVGFDDYEWMQARRTGITAIKQPVESIARSVWEQLKSRIAGDESKVVNTVHECDLVVRESVQRLHSPEKSTGVQAKETNYNEIAGKKPNGASGPSSISSSKTDS